MLQYDISRVESVEAHRAFDEVVVVLHRPAGHEPVKLVLPVEEGVAHDLADRLQRAADAVRSSNTSSAARPAGSFWRRLFGGAA